MHFAQNVLARVPKAHQDVVAAALRTVFVHPNAIAISAAWDRTATVLVGCLRNDRGQRQPERRFAPLGHPKRARSAARVSVAAASAGSAMGKVIVTYRRRPMRRSSARRIRSHNRLASAPRGNSTAPVFTPRSHAHIPHDMWCTPSRASNRAGRLFTKFATPAAPTTRPANACGVLRPIGVLNASAGTTRAATAARAATPNAVSSGT